MEPNSPFGNGMAYSSASRIHKPNGEGKGSTSGAFGSELVSSTVSVNLSGGKRIGSSERMNAAASATCAHINQHRCCKIYELITHIERKWARFHVFVLEERLEHLQCLVD